MGVTHDGVMPQFDFKISYYLSDHLEPGHASTLVIPGSHLKEQALHKKLAAAHSTEVRATDHTKDPAHMDAPGCKYTHNLPRCV